MRRSTVFIGLLTAVSLGFATAPAAWAGTSTATGAPASVTIAGPSPATLAFPFARTGDSAYDVWVHYKTENGTAIAGTDYVGAAGAFRLAAGAAAAALPIVALGASTDSPDKQFTLDLLGAVGVGSTPAFAMQQTFGAGNQPRSVTAADVNGDGKSDLIAANNIGNSVSVLVNITAPGAASPGFAVQQTFPVGSSPQSVAAADVNGDGKPDLVVANGADNTVSVLLNTTVPGGAASFATQQSFGVGTSPNSVTTADVNGDGKPDLIVANATSPAGSVSVLLNTTAPGAATPSFASQQTFSVGGAPYSVTTADVNGDGKPDLIVANFGVGTVSVLENVTAPGAATPSFAAQQTFGVGVAPFSVTTADVNGDGKPDLIAANQGDSTVSVLLNTTVLGGAASFATHADFGVGTNVASVTAADLNGDGKPDLIAANSNSPGGSVSVLVNTTAPGATTASFATQQTFAVGNQPFSVAVADVNGDGRPDLIVANSSSNNVSVLMNTTPAPTAALSFATQQTFVVGSLLPTSVAAADVNGDGKPDLIVAGGVVFGTVSVLVNTTAPGGAVSFAAHADFPVGGGPESVTTADVNGDGKPDLIVANKNENTVSVLVNDSTPGGAPSFAAQQPFTVGVSPVWVTTADVNGDGKPDPIVGYEADNTVSVLMNTTAPGDPPSFAAYADFPVENFSVSVTTADVNGDGKPDLITANDSSNTVSVLLNTTAPGATSPSFAPQQAFSVGGVARVTTADVNGDGKPDLITTNAPPGTVSVLVNTTAPGETTPSFAAQQTFPVGSLPASVTTADVNGDGKPDLITANRGGNNVSVLVNTTAPGGAASFATQRTFSVGSLSSSVTTADVNGDGKPDLVTANPNVNGTVSVLVNTQYAATVTPASVTGTIHYDVPAPVVTLAPTPLTFADQVVAVSSAPENITLTNSGAADLANIAISVAGANPVDFAQTNDCPQSPASLAPGADCTIQVVFTPVVAGARAATLEVSSNAATSPDGVVLSGTGVAAHPELDVTPDSLDFGDEPVGTTSAVQTVTVSNGGNVSLDITGVSAAGANPGDFALASNGCSATLAPGEDCTMSFSFTPTAGGARSASETVATDDPCASATITVSGTGLAPAVSLDPASLVFGSQQVGIGTVMALTVKNTGNAVLDFSAAASISGADAGDFAIASDDCGATLAATASCTIAVRFTPTVVGARTASLDIPSDAPAGNPQAAALSGTGANTPPVANPQNVSTTTNVPVPITLTATDPDPGQTLTYIVVTQPMNGALSGTAPNLTYTPAANFAGADSFTFKANDGNEDSNTAMVTIAVTDNPPTASNGNASTTTNVTVNGQLVAQAHNPNQTLSYVLVGGAAHGVVVVTVATGAFTYTPATGFAGSDSFTFRANDGNEDSNTATVTIMVADLPPIAHAGEASTTTNVAVSGQLQATNPDGAGQTLAFQIVQAPASGSVGVNAGTGAFTYTPKPGFAGTDHFTFRVFDGYLYSNTAPVTITVTDKPPVASDGNVSTTVNRSVAGQLEAAAKNPGQHLTYAVVQAPASGTVSVNAATGAFSYTPAAGFVGNDHFTFQANDGNADSNTATETIAVKNTPPVAENGSIATDANHSVSGQLKASDADPGQTLTYRMVSTPVHGKLSLDAATGAFIYTSNHNYVGSDSFTFNANDGVDDSNVATIGITVKTGSLAVRGGPGGGGGGFGFYGLFALLLLAAFMLWRHRGPYDGNPMTSPSRGSRPFSPSFRGSRRENPESCSGRHSASIRQDSGSPLRGVRNDGGKTREASAMTRTGLRFALFATTFATTLALLLAGGGIARAAGDPGNAWYVGGEANIIKADGGRDVATHGFKGWGLYAGKELGRFSIELNAAYHSDYPKSLSAAANWVSYGVNGLWFFAGRHNPAFSPFALGGIGLMREYRGDNSEFWSVYDALGIGFTSRPWSAPVRLRVALQFQATFAGNYGDFVAVIGIEIPFGGD